MSLDYWLAFVLASAIILVIPSPTIILVLSQATVHGKKSVIPLTTGVLLGDFTAVTCSLIGLGAVIATSATLFTLFKWAGASYLVYLGLQAWRLGNQQKKAAVALKKERGSVLLRKSYLVTAFNPKSIAFFIAFLPQFIAPHKPANPQMVILATTFLCMATVNAFIYALFAAQMNRVLLRRKRRVWLNRVGGTTLIGAGLLTAAMKQQ